MNITYGQGGPLQAYYVLFGAFTGLDWTAVDAELTVLASHQTSSAVQPLSPWTFEALSATSARFTYIPNRLEFGGQFGDWRMVPTLTIDGEPLLVPSWNARVNPQ